jgi:succinate dehydrogenase/fumarate reductase flavoprotein subunit
MRAWIGLVALLFATPALAGGAPSEPAQELQQEQVRERIGELEAQRKKLEEERDAAKVRANIYVLPQDKLQVLDKTKEIEETDEELRKLREEQRRLQQAPPHEEAPAPR